MGWAKFRDKFLDVAAPVAGFALGGPAGAALAGGVRQGYKKDESGKRWNLGNIAKGAISGYAGGALAQYGGIQGGQGFGKMFGSVGNFSPSQMVSGAKGALGGMLGGGGGGLSSLGGMLGGGGGGGGMWEALAAGVPAYLNYQGAKEGLEAQEGGVNEANARLDEAYQGDQAAYTPYEQLGAQSLGGMRNFQGTSAPQYSGPGTYQGPGPSPQAPTWQGAGGYRTPQWSGAGGAYQAPTRGPGRTFDAPQWSQDLVEPDDPNLSGQALLEQDPGYAFRMAEGKKALEQSQAAKGGLFSGEAGKELARYSQGLASQEYGAAADRQRQRTLDNRSWFADRRNFGRAAFEDDRNFGRGAFESDRAYDTNVFESDRDFGRNVFSEERDFSRNAFEDDRNFDRNRYSEDRAFDRGAFESDRGFNQARFEGDRAFSRAGFDADRAFGRGAFESDRAFGASQDQARWGRLSDMVNLGVNARDRLANSRNNWATNTATNRLALGDARANARMGKLGAIAGGFNDYVQRRRQLEEYP